MGKCLIEQSTAMIAAIDGDILNKESKGTRNAAQAFRCIWLSVTSDQHSESCVSCGEGSVAQAHKWARNTWMIQYIGSYLHPYHDFLPSLTTAFVKKKNQHRGPALISHDR